MGKLFVHFLNQDQIDALHAAGHGLEVAAVSEGQAVVAKLKTLPLGATVSGIISTLTDKQMSGAEKFASVVAQATPLVVEAVATHGLSLVASAEDTAHEVVQSIYNDTVGAAEKALGTLGK